MDWLVATKMTYYFELKSLFRQLKCALENQKEMRKLGERRNLCSDSGEVPSIQGHCRKPEILYNYFILFDKDLGSRDEWNTDTTYITLE